MSTTQTDFDQLQAELAQGGVPAVLERLATQLRQRKKYHELFEALKMQVRQRLGVPLLYSDLGDELAPQKRDELEEGLLAACREVGVLLLEDGHVREGWIYLRPVGDKATAARLLAAIEPGEENLDDFVEVCLHEGVDTARGFSLVLEHYGTCNAITTFESAVAQRSRGEQQIAAGLLVEHVHEELLATVRADVARQESREPAESTLGELVADRDWLFGDNAYHIDTTHLASTVRFSRLLENKAQLRLALDLTEYGRHLGEQFQYQAEEPFADLYPSHALYFQALMGENVEAALDYFRQRAETLDSREHGSMPIDVYVDLLVRLERYEQAIDALLGLLASRNLAAESHRHQGMPSLLEISEKAGSYDKLMQYCREHDDLLGFVAGLVQASSSRSAS